MSQSSNQPLLQLSKKSRKRRQNNLSSKETIILNHSEHTLCIIWAHLTFYFEQGFIEETLYWQEQKYRLNDTDKSLLLTKLTEVGWQYKLVKKTQTWISLTISF